ncbi:hypothetical protein ACFVMC_00665 [Nocardia sp. NPDC127579]|uniref:LppU/SCO3897 family protein n=1 Tax=Nocardia sp. NPDC127579 TaxID=3345402 RepID=UPI0036326294
MTMPPNYGPPPRYPYPPSPFPPPTPRDKVMGWVKVVAPVVVLFLVAGVFWLLRGSGPSIAIGECGTLSGSPAEAKFTPADCADPTANYVVAQRLDGADADCATKDYASYYQDGGTEFTLCLRLNAAEGDCFVGGSSRASTRVECTGLADFKVGRIVRGAAAVSACGAVGAVDNTFVFPEPEPLTFCLVAPK